MPQAKFFRIMVSRRVFYLPELITFFVQNHQVTHEIPPGDAERPLRHLWALATCLNNSSVTVQLFVNCLAENMPFPLHSEIINLLLDCLQT